MKTAQGPVKTGSRGHKASHGGSMYVTTVLLLVAVVALVGYLVASLVVPERF